MTSTPTTPKRTVRFAEKLVSAAHEPKIYGPEEQDSKSKRAPEDKKDEDKTQEVEEIIDFSTLDFDDPRRIWAETKAKIMATWPAIPEATSAPGDKTDEANDMKVKKDEGKDPKDKKEKSSRKKSAKADKKKSSSRSKDTKGETDKSTSRSKDSEAEKTESSGLSEAAETEKTKPPKTEPPSQSEALEAEEINSSTDKEAESKTPSSDSTKTTTDGPETPAANTAIAWVFPAEEQEDTPNFKTVARKTYGIYTYPMDSDYTLPTDQSRVAADEKRGYQLDNWKEDVPYTAGENERTGGLGFEYGSENWKRERTAYAKVWGHLDEAEAAAKRESGVAVAAAS